MKLPLGCVIAALVVLGACVEPEPEPGPETDTDVGFVTLNLLHGLFCPPDSCRSEDRVDLLIDWIGARGCPDFVALQEIVEPTAALLAERLSEPCEFSYDLIAGREQFGFDDEVLLSRYPAELVQLVFLEGGFRHVLHARMEHPLGLVDLLSTHLSSGSDGGPDACPDCPQACLEAGAVTKRDCQAVQLASAAAARGGDITLVAGDLNDPPDSFLGEHFAGLGWTDAHAEAGLPECDPSSGVGCTSGRDDEDLLDLESPALGTDERIDYVFIASAQGCALEPAGDGDGDGAPTALFASEPNPFGAACGPAPAPICWPSDHVGVQVDLNCGD